MKPRAGATFAGCYRLDQAVDGNAAPLWLARDTRSGERLTLKFIPQALLRSPGGAGTLSAAVARFRSLDHPSLALTRGVIAEGGDVAVVRHWVEGRSLAQALAAQPAQRFEVRQIKDLIFALARALEVVHAARLVHGALKPTNIFVDPHGALRVTDFAVGAWLTAQIFQSGPRASASAVTPYLSPAQARGEAPLPADDVYAFGVMIYELLTGRPPFFTGKFRRKIASRIPPPMVDRRKEFGFAGEPIPLAWEQTVAACLAKDAYQRPVGFGAVLKMFEQLGGPNEEESASTAPAAAARAQASQAIAKPSREEAPVPRKPAVVPAPSSPPPPAAAPIVEETLPAKSEAVANVEKSAPPREEPRPVSPEPAPHEEPESALPQVAASTPAPAPAAEPETARPAPPAPAPAPAAPDQTRVVWSPSPEPTVVFSPQPWTGHPPAAASARVPRERPAAAAAAARSNEPVVSATPPAVQPARATAAAPQRARGTSPAGGAGGTTAVQARPTVAPRGQPAPFTEDFLTGADASSGAPIGGVGLDPGWAGPGGATPVPPQRVHPGFGGHRASLRWDVVFLRGLITLVMLAVAATGGWYGWQLFQTQQQLDGIETKLARLPAKASDTQIAEIDAAFAAMSPTWMAGRQRAARENWQRRKTAIAEQRAASQPGGAIVRTSPAGAQVQIGDRPAERGPVELSDLTPGQYPVIARLDGYADFEGTLVVKPGEVASLEAKLERQTGSLRLDSEPRGASFEVVDLSGREPPRRGTAPAQLELPVGKYRATFTQPGSPVSDEKTIDIAANGVATASAHFADGTLAVTRVNDANAVVLVDGVERGKAPLKLTLPAGPHDVALAFEDGHREEQQVSIQPERTLIVAAEGPPPPPEPEPESPPPSATSPAPSISAPSPVATVGESDAGTSSQENQPSSPPPDVTPPPTEPPAEATIASSPPPPREEETSSSPAKQEQQPQPEAETPAAASSSPKKASPLPSSALSVSETNAAQSPPAENNPPAASEASSSTSSPSSSASSAAANESEAKPPPSSADTDSETAASAPTNAPTKNAAPQVPQVVPPISIAATPTPSLPSSSASSPTSPAARAVPAEPTRPAAVEPQEVEPAATPPSRPIAAPEPHVTPPPPAPQEPAIDYNRVFELREVNVRPVLMERVAPKISARVLRSINGGRVELAFVLDRYGGVAFVAVQSASDDRLKEPSLEAARSWRFSPARKDGHPVSVRVVVPVVFPKHSR